jgi:hypothetical protein
MVTAIHVVLKLACKGLKHGLQRHFVLIAKRWKNIAKGKLENK